MSRIDAAFRDLRTEERVGLVTYVTAGDPDLERSRLWEIVYKLLRHGLNRTGNLGERVM